MRLSQIVCKNATQKLVETFQEEFEEFREEMSTDWACRELRHLHQEEYENFRIEERNKRLEDRQKIIDDLRKKRLERS